MNANSAEEMKTALITGGSSGLGLAMARRLSKQGFRVVLVARNEERLEKAVRDINAQGGQAFSWRADITVASDLEVVKTEVQERFGTLQFLILNAGVVHTDLLSDYEDIEVMKEDLNVDLWGSILTVKYLGELLEPGSRILIISSVLGLFGLAGYSIYCSAKAGLINFGECLRRELLAQKIAVHVAVPADMDTPQYQQEAAGMPDWLRAGIGQRTKPLAPEIAASRILKQCKGNRFLITLDGTTKLILVLCRILPRGIRDRLIDRISPLPKADLQPESS